METGILIGCAILLLMIYGGVWCRQNEKREWNFGTCRECGTAWIHFDTDSQDGRMYHCGCPERHTVDISYNVDQNIS